MRSFFIGLVLSIAAAASAASRLERIVGDFDAYVAADGLVSPDGIALHPISGELYVSEEDAGRISVIRNGRAVPVIEKKIRVQDDIPSWAVGAGRKKSDWLVPELRNPEGIAFHPDGRLYVVEDTPGGRLLEFTPDTSGNYRTARAIPIPWAAEPFAWESIAIARDGRLFLAGSSLERGGFLESGTVLMRDTNLDWWIVDYGPFAGFSSIGLSGEEDILVVGDEATGAVTCWDAVRQSELETFTKPVAHLESLCVLPDGSLLLTQESAPGSPDGRPDHGRLIRVDPSTGESSVVAEGLSNIESVFLHPGSGYVYLTEDTTGLLLELRPKNPFVAGESLLRRTALAAEVKQGLAPKKAPPFLTDFFQKMGVTLVPENPENAALPTRTGADKGKKEFTLEELGTLLPMIAGKVRMTEADPLDPDPVEEINFFSLFPNRVTRSGDIVNPSFSFFAARHRSGKMQRTMPLMGFSALHRNAEGAWSRVSNRAELYLPLTTCSAQSDDQGVTVTMCFVGLGIFQDYYMTLKCGKDNTGLVATDGSGGRLVSSRASIVDMGANGEEQLNVVMTGMTPKKRLGMGWLNIGKHNKWSMILPERGPWISRWLEANVPGIVMELKRRDAETLLAIQTLPEEDQQKAAVRSPPAIYRDDPNRSQPVIIEDHARKTEEEETRQSLTNILLSKVFDLWRQTTF